MSVSTAHRHYELLLIHDPPTSTSDGRTDHRQDVPQREPPGWRLRGERRHLGASAALAFEIKTNPEGIYAVIKVTCPSAVVSPNWTGS